MWGKSGYTVSGLNVLCVGWGVDVMDVINVGLDGAFAGEDGGGGGVSSCGSRL